MKHCIICNQTKSNLEFYKKNSGKDGLQSRCKSCMANYLSSRDNKPVYDGKKIQCSTCQIEKSKSHFYPDRRQKHGLRPQCKRCNRDTALKREFGITLRQYEAVLHSQGSACGICQTDKPGGTGTFAVDHCHGSGEVRGLLCSNCNTALGLFKDSEESLLKAIIYLRKSQDAQVS